MKMMEPAAQRPSVGYRDLREYLQLLESKGLLHHVTAPVDLKYELGAIAARSLERKGPAIVFDNIKGYAGKPLVANIISTTQQLAVAFNTEVDEEQIHQRVVRGMIERIPSVTLPTGPCKEVIVKGDDIDIDMVPTPYWHEHDGGRYLGTTTGFITRDPLTGDLNMGSYRVMIKDKKTLSMAGGLRGRKTSTGAAGGDHILDNEKEGRSTAVAIVCGMDPLLTLASGSPVAPGPGGSMEYEAAAGWRGAPTELVKCETNDLLVPAQAEMIIEGVVPPRERTEEGPHGESTGFYGENKDAFVVHITCITHRRNPISYGLICQRVEDYPRQLLRSGSIQARVVQKTGLTNIKEVYFPEVGRMGMLIVSAKIRDKDDPKRIMDGIWNDTGEPWRWIIVVDDDCNVRDWDDVMWRVVSAVEPEKHVILGKIHNVPKRKTNEVDFDAPNRGMGIDATFWFKEAKFPPVNKVSGEIMAGVAARWKEFGLP
jgi:4-hydroxy-3-polyprenylbenzoate decarboxylase